MSSHVPSSQNPSGNVSRKFESQFTDINQLLDKVIERNSRVVDLAGLQGVTTSCKTPNAHENSVQPKSFNEYMDNANQKQSQHLNYINNAQNIYQKSSIEHPGNSYTSPKREETNLKGEVGYGTRTGNYQIRSPGDAEQKFTRNEAHQTNTPVKDNYYSQSLKSTTESKRYNSQSPNDESYDYTRKHYGSPDMDLAKPKQENHKSTRFGKGLDTTQDIIINSVNNHDDFRNMAEPSTLNQTHDLQERIRKSTGQTNNDVSVLNASHNTDIFGEKSSEKCMIPKRDRKHKGVNMVDANLIECETDMSYLYKYTPLETIKTIESSSDGKYFVVDPLKKDKNSIKLPSTGVQDPINQIVVLNRPDREVEPSENLVSIYQQVSETYDDGTSYIGEKFLGLRQGKGTYQFKDGYRYEGTWEEDQMSGFGILWVTDDIKWYEGEWKNGTFHGRGIIYNLTPEELDAEKFYSDDLNQIRNGWEKYEGKFDQGAKNGFGTLFLTNGDTFTGNFNLDNVDGRGSYAKNDRKKVIAGVWKNNILKSSF